MFDAQLRGDEKTDRADGHHDELGRDQCCLQRLTEVDKHHQGERGYEEQH